MEADLRTWCKLQPSDEGRFQCRGHGVIHAAHWSCCGSTDPLTHAPGCHSDIKIKAHPHALRNASGQTLAGPAPGGWICDVCNRDGAELQGRWRCSEGSDFDACGKCVSTGPTLTDRGFHVGARVQLAAGYARQRDAIDGPLKPGFIGEVIHSEPTETSNLHSSPSNPD